MGWQGILNSSGILFAGFVGTVVLSIATIVTGTILGLLVAVLRTAHIRGLGVPLRIYLEVFRGSPLLVQMLFIYFGAAYLGLRFVETFTAALIALTLYEGALISEIFRAGIEAVPKGQREASRSLGLSRVQIERYVILPQTATIVLPPLVGQYIGLVKDTALAAAIGYFELVREGQAIIDRIGMPIEVFAVVSVIYFVICYPMSLFARRLELRTLHP
ncbi:MAG TPA: amino acid ABC transporter permease [Cellulomonadaceae bacterium]|nr:amino acid ABC transporter permease [Cellulomonadaceae bacterium]